MSQLMSHIRRGAGEAGAAIRSVDFPGLLESHRGEIEKALPKHLPVDRIMRIALTAFRKVPALADCDPISVLAAVIQASQLGLEVQQNGEAYLVTFDRECQLIPGYKGLMKLARNSGLVRDIFAHEVRVKDHFDCDFGVDRRLTHKPLLGEGNFPAPDALRGHVVGYYAVALLRDGTPTFVLKHALDVEAIRDESRGYQSARRRNKATVWDTHPVAMGKKTVIRQLCNSQLPMSAELQIALALDTADLMGVKQGISLQQAADGFYEPPALTDDPWQPPVFVAPRQTQQAYATSRPASAREDANAYTARPAASPQNGNAPVGQGAAGRAPASRSPVPSSAPATPPAPRPQREAVRKSELDMTIDEMRRCAHMNDLDEVSIRAESIFSGADLERINQVYAEVRGKLVPTQTDLYR